MLSATCLDGPRVGLEEELGHLALARRHNGKELLNQRGVVARPQRLACRAVSSMPRDHYIPHTENSANRSSGPDMGGREFNGHICFGAAAIFFQSRQRREVYLVTSWMAEAR